MIIINIYSDSDYYIIVLHPRSDLRRSAAPASHRRTQPAPAQAGEHRACCSDLTHILKSQLPSIFTIIQSHGVQGFSETFQKCAPKIPYRASPHMNRRPVWVTAPVKPSPQAAMLTRSPSKRSGGMRVGLCSRSSLPRESERESERASERPGRGLAILADKLHEH